MPILRLSPLWQPVSLRCRAALLRVTAMRFTYRKILGTAGTTVTRQVSVSNKSQPSMTPQSTLGTLKLSFGTAVFFVDDWFLNMLSKVPIIAVFGLERNATDEPKKPQIRVRRLHHVTSHIINQDN